MSEWSELRQFEVNFDLGMAELSFYPDVEGDGEVVQHFTDINTTLADLAQAASDYLIRRAA